jgi:hypothetical protein
MLQEGSAKLAAYLERADSERVSDGAVSVLGKVQSKVGGAAGGAALLNA